MYTKLTTTCLVAGALMLPIAGYAADSKSDSSSPKASDSSSAKTFVKDSVITTKVKAGLAEDKMSSLAHIGVDTDDQGKVTLSGTAATKSAADKAVTIARAVTGVTSVKNDISIKAD
jgi:hyperosmotically inducible periplasmic protein